MVAKASKVARRAAARGSRALVAFGLALATCKYDVNLGTPIGLGGASSTPNAPQGGAGGAADGSAGYGAIENAAGASGANGTPERVPWSARLSWQYQLTEPVDTALPVDVFTLDLFDTPRATLDAIHARGGWVLCYFSAGTLEAGRPDSSLIPDSARGEPARRANEVWLDVRTTSVREWALGRLDRAKNLGCDGVHPTSIDGYLEGPATGFPWDEATSLSYVRFLASEARARGLLAGLVNSVELAAALAPDVDFAANEECLRFDECARLADFVRLGKPVFHLEYVADAADGAATLEQVCADPTRSKFNTILKLGPSAGAWLLACE